MKNLILLTVIAVASLQVASLAKAADHEDKAAEVHHFTSDSAASDRDPQSSMPDDNKSARADESVWVDSPAHGPNGRMNWTR